MVQMMVPIMANLWVAYYNFLRPHEANDWKPLNKVAAFDEADNMPAK